MDVMLRRLGLATAAWIGLASGTFAGEQDGGASRSLAEPPTGAVRGQVRDPDGRPIAEAVVVLCDARTGVPIGANSKRAFLEPDEESAHPSLDDWWYALTGADGRFAFTGVPVGRYRLVAQSYPDVEHPEGPFETKAMRLHLRGVAENVEVPSAMAEAIAIDPLGDGTFVYHRGAGNSGFYLILSTGAVAADPVLGPLGWKGPFLEQSVGCVRMRAGQVIVRGLPERLVHFAIFANDNMPGFGAGSFYARSDKIAVEDTYVVAGWSDGIHEPPERLEPLCAEIGVLIETGGNEAVETLLAHGREDAWAARPDCSGFERLFVAAEILGPLDREIELPVSGTWTVGDVLAAAAYGAMQR